MFSELSKNKAQISGLTVFTYRTGSTFWTSVYSTSCVLITKRANLNHDLITFFWLGFVLLILLFFNQGAAAFWFNLLKSGESDARTRHAGCPVIVGSKWGKEFNQFCHENFNANKLDIKLINEKQCSFISLSSFSFQQVDS